MQLFSASFVFAKNLLRDARRSIVKWAVAAYAFVVSLALQLQKNTQSCCRQSEMGPIWGKPGHWHHYIGENNQSLVLSLDCLIFGFHVQTCLHVLCDLHPCVLGALWEFAFWHLTGSWNSQNATWKKLQLMYIRLNFLYSGSVYFLNIRRLIPRRRAWYIHTGKEWINSVFSGSLLAPPHYKLFRISLPHNPVLCIGCSCLKAVGPCLPYRTFVLCIGTQIMVMLPGILTNGSWDTYTRRDVYAA